METRRILVLTSSTGGGHNARAYALQGWMEKRYGKSVDVKIEKILENSSAFTRFGVWLYNWIQQYAPVLHNIYWWVVEIFGIISARLWLIGNGYYRGLLLRYKPHAIFSVHDATNGPYFRIAKHVLAHAGVKCVTYCGEFTGGFGFSRHWVTSYADLLYARTDSAKQHIIKLGISPEKVRVIQTLLDPEKFYHLDAFGGENRHQFRTEELGLTPGKFTVFLATGSIGANNHVTLLEVLVPLTERVQAIVVCGKNKTLFHKLSTWKTKNPRFTIHVEGNSTRMHDLLRASDVIVTPGGSNTAIEALFCGCPIIFNCLRAVMPQERLTINYFLDNNAAVAIKTREDFQRIITQWMQFSDGYRDVKAKLKELCVDDDPRQLVDEVVEFANAVRYDRNSYA